MHPYLEEARDQVAEQYRPQLAACDRLRDHAIALLENWKGRPLDPEKHEEAILGAIFARSLNTYWAAIELARVGFGEQAAMLQPITIRGHGRRALGFDGTRARRRAL